MRSSTQDKVAATRKPRSRSATKVSMTAAISQPVEEQGLPVRVIRSWEGDPEYSSANGYRYDGLYTVAHHWQEPSVDGAIVCRFRLERLDRGEQFGGQLEDPHAAPPAGTDQPDRAISAVLRVVRNTRVSQWVNSVYDFTCQVCGIRLELDAGAYAEGAHIRPLGAPHDGPDRPDNVLCLCPNDHVLFDKGALYISDGRAYRRRIAQRLEISEFIRTTTSTPKRSCTTERGSLE